MTTPRGKGRAQRVTENRKTTINLDPTLKLRAKLLAVRTGRDLQDLIAEGLKLVLARHGGGR